MNVPFFPFFLYLKNKHGAIISDVDSYIIHM